ncbi:hypothetical protein CVT25_009661 [Psilocybe cyanescens]|uniref:Uncharacterized protein n=1 Tax=Psilocybe cyanescens TaxID=93625 RepID=A0A409XH07_PSICY|nr:hypothetical protein CVT25_009661 [Psilocybe cyanescens]
MIIYIHTPGSGANLSRLVSRLLVVHLFVEIASIFKTTRQILTLVLSTLALILIITNSVILKHAPFWDTYWQRWVNPRVVGWVSNARVNVPVLINIVADLTFAVGTIISMVRWIGKMPYDDCHSRYSWQDKTTIPPHPKCKDWKLVLNIIMGFTAAFGILLA